MLKEKKLWTRKFRKKVLRLGGGVRPTDDLSLVKERNFILVWDGYRLIEIGVYDIESASKEKLIISGGYLEDKGKIHVARPTSILTIPYEEDKEYFIINNKKRLIKKAGRYFSGKKITTLTYLDSIDLKEDHEEKESTLLKIIEGKNGDEALLLKDIEGRVQNIDGKLRLNITSGFFKWKLYNQAGRNIKGEKGEFNNGNMKYNQFTIAQLRKFFSVNDNARYGL